MRLLNAGPRSGSRRPDRLQIPGILRIRFDFFADAAHINIDRTWSHIGCVTPDRIEQLVARENAPGVPHKVVEQAEFGGGGRNLFAAHGQRHRRGINVHLFDLGRQRRQGPLETAQHGLDTGHQFARTERFGDVVIGTQFQSQYAIGLATFRGQKNYRNRCQRDRLPDLTAKFQAIFPGHHDIEQEQRRTLAFRVRHDHIASRIQTHVEASALQMMAYQAGNIRVVFHYKDRRFHGHHCSREM